MQKGEDLYLSLLPPSYHLQLGKEVWEQGSQVGKGGISIQTVGRFVRR